MMKQRKRLYNLPRSLQTDEAWSNYRKLNNKITNSIRESHNKYQNSLFLQDGGLMHLSMYCPTTPPSGIYGAIVGI